MSHVAKIKVQIQSLDALQAACGRLGLDFMAGQTSYKAYNNRLGLNKCEHVIQVPGASYTVGVVQKDGYYELMWDPFVTGGLVPILGENAQNLINGYTLEAARLKAQSQGYSSWEEVDQNTGTVRLHVTV